MHAQRLTAKGAPPAATSSGRRRALTRAEGASRWLLACGIGLVALYTAMTVRLALPRYFPGPGVTVGFPQMLGDDWLRVSLLYSASVVAAFLLYGIAVAAVWRNRTVSLTTVFVFGGLFVLALLYMYPPAAMDVVHYHADARTFWVFGDNPLVVPPSAHPYPVGMSWGDRASAYGPVWSLLTGFVVVPTGDHFIAGIVGLKLLAAAFGIGCGWLIVRIVSRIRPGWESVAAVLFLWNPFVMLRVAAHGHNDIVMMFFVLLALERAQQRDWLVALPAIAASVLVKYISALLIPVLLWYAWDHTPGTARERLRALAPGVGAALLVTLLAYAPFWDGTNTFATLREQINSEKFMITSLPLLLQIRLNGSLGPEQALHTAQTITRLMFLALYLPLLWQARRDFRRLVTCSFTVLFLYIVVAGGWFRPWYMLWPLTVAAVLPGTWFTAMLIVVSLFNCFPDLVEQYRNNWDWLADYWRAESAPVVVSLWPALLVWYSGLLVFSTWHFDVPWRTGAVAPRPKSRARASAGVEGAVPR